MNTIFPGICAVEDQVAVHRSLCAVGPLAGKEGVLPGICIIYGIAVSLGVGKAEAVSPERKLVDDLIGFLPDVLMVVVERGEKIAAARQGTDACHLKRHGEGLGGLSAAGADFIEGSDLLAGFCLLFVLRISGCREKKGVVFRPYIGLGVAAACELAHLFFLQIVKMEISLVCIVCLVSSAYNEGDISSVRGECRVAYELELEKGINFNLLHNVSFFFR